VSKRPEPNSATASEQLLRAAADGDPHRVRALLAAGAYINATNQHNQTALIRAAFFGHDEVVRVLLAAGAETQTRDKVGLTALEWSVSRGFSRAAELLRNVALAVPTKTAPNEQSPPAEPPTVTTNPLVVKQSGQFTESRFSEPGVVPAATAAQTNAEAPNDEVIKHCPVCQTIYKGPTLFYCSYDLAPLVDGPVAAPGAPASKSIFEGQALLWVVLAVAAFAGMSIGYLINYRLAESPPKTMMANRMKNDYPTEVRNSPIVEGEIKSSEINLPEPEYPEAAKSQGLSGSVSVAVTVSSKGRVIKARALNGPLLLQKAAEAAARKATFTKRRARRSGTITYDFVR